LATGNGVILVSEYFSTDLPGIISTSSKVGTGIYKKGSFFGLSHCVLCGGLLEVATAQDSKILFPSAVAT
jgi:hypothetical protein